MERECKICLKTKKTPYKDICRACYQTQWMDGLKEKNCDKCNSSFKGSGKVCHSCLSNLRNEKSRSIKCLGCSRDGLIIKDKTNSLCIKCDRQRLEEEDPDRKEKRRKYLMLYSRKKKGTDLDAPKRKSTGEWKSFQGYVITYKKDHPNSRSTGCLLKHVLVMSEHIGRPIKANENVHHINGVRDDNRIENLELWHRGQCSGQRLHEKLEWSKKFLEEYGYTVTAPEDK